MSNASLVLVLDNGWKQEAVGGGRWHDVQQMPEPLRIHGLTHLKQEINEPGWRFDAVFKDVGNSSLAQAKTGWDMSEENPAVLFATSSVDYAAGRPEVILTTAANESTRIIWRAWSIELFERAPKWASFEERQADEAAHERALCFPFDPRGILETGVADSERRPMTQADLSRIHMTDYVDDGWKREVGPNGPTDFMIRVKGGENKQ